jgi:hypothetical protein
MSGKAIAQRAKRKACDSNFYAMRHAVTIKAKPGS